MWTATGYTELRIDKAGQLLSREYGTVAEWHQNWELAILEAHFPPVPSDRYDTAEGERAFEKVYQDLVGSLLGKASKTSASGGDHILADIVKVFWQWDPKRFTQLVRACI